MKSSRYDKKTRISSTVDKHTRRDFLPAAGVAGAVLLPASASADAAAEAMKGKPAPPTVPKRPFGKTGENVSALALGGYFNTRNNQPLLKQAIKMGVTYWEAAFSRPGGKDGYGDYFKNNPDDRKKVFLLAKTPSGEPDVMTRDLDETLKALHTSYVDFFIIHAIDRISILDGKLREWADRAKAARKIRFFGFSTHKNMEQCIVGASELGWIDGIVTVYNYRLMNTTGMKKAVDACAEKGIALTAIKSQAAVTNPAATIGRQSDLAMKLTEVFLRKGFTVEQAKLMAIWKEPHIASICSLMPNMTVLLSNVAASSHRTGLSSDDLGLLKRHARETASEFCAGCAHICEPTVGGGVPISDVMKYLMYARSYGDRDLAASLFGRLPKTVRKKIVDSDYSEAERKCPQKMSIGKLMKEAAEELT